MSTETEITELRVRVDQMEEDLRTIKADVKAIRSKTDKASGVFGFLIITVPAAIGAAGTWLWQNIGSGN